jgi:ribosome-binding protein aMBF1 (putative translation factor)
MCRERTISFPWPFLVPSASHERPETEASDAEEIQATDIAEVIRGNLLRLCRAQDLSLLALAARADVNLSDLEALASGRSFPALGLLLKLARAFDLPCTVFIEEPLTVGCRSAKGAPQPA